MIPKSSVPLYVTDNEGNQLWTVVVFRKNVDSFKTKARNTLKVYVREFEYNEKSYEEDKKKIVELQEKCLTTQAELAKTCEIIYSALFECVMHLKALRIHVECVLRWGVPPNYFMCIYRVIFTYFTLGSLWERKENHSKFDKDIH